MKKLGVLLLLILLCPIISGMYGLVHDQITYTISPEYYTKFKFINSVVDANTNERWLVAKTGFLATWWIGIYFGLGIGIVGLIHHSSRDMRRISFQSIYIALGTTLLIGLIGLGYGFVFLSNESPEHFQYWFIPPNLEHYSCYIAVYSMHNFSYFGSALGLVAAPLWHFLKRDKTGRK